MIDTIWFSEGFAQYAAIMALAAGRADAVGLPRDEACEIASRGASRKRPNSYGGCRPSSSPAASTRYASDFRTGSSSFARGGMMAAEMDDLIRARTGGREEPARRAAWSARVERFAAPGLPPGRASGAARAGRRCRRRGPLSRKMARTAASPHLAHDKRTSPGWTESKMPRGGPMRTPHCPRERPCFLARGRRPRAGPRRHLSQSERPRRPGGQKATGLLRVPARYRRRH